MSGEQNMDAVVEEVLARLAGRGVVGGTSNLDGRSCTGCAAPGQCASVCPRTTVAMLSAGAQRVGNAPGPVAGCAQDMAGVIDHTVLKADTVESQIDQILAEAKEYSFASVCVNPYWVKKCSEYLRGTPVKTCTVVGFPLGANSSETKAFETRRACYDGAEEIDMVLNVGALRSGDLGLVEKDIRGVVESTGPGVIVKVILETAYLNDEQKISACIAAKRAGAHFVKTSTGFGPSGATVHDIALMRSTVGPGLGVKASGGVKTREDAEDMLRAGATRIGASASISIVEGER